LTSNKSVNKSVNNHNDNRNWWPNEIPIPSDAISDSTTSERIVAGKNKSTPINQIQSASVQNTQTQNTQTAQDNLIPPRKLEPIAIEPKPLAEIPDNAKRINNVSTQNEKIAQPESNQQINSNDQQTSIKTVAANESSKNQSDDATNSSNKMTLREFESLLINTKWQPNIQLELWLEKKINEKINKNEISSRERREQIKQLNFSEKEKSKKFKNQKYIDELISTWRWYNVNIDELVKKQLEPDTEARPIFPVDPKIFLENNAYNNAKYNQLRANAAILMGRCNDYDAVNTLVEIVKNEQLDSIRCAAVETLGKMEFVGFETLLPLLEFARKRNNVTNNQSDNIRNNNYNDDNSPDEKSNDQNNHKNQITVINKILWSELLIALANKMETWEHPCFLDSLAIDEVEVRRTSAKLWRLRSQAFWTKNRGESNYRNEKDQTIKLRKLPARFLVFARLENDLPARIEMIKTLAIWKEPEILNIIENDLNSHNAQLRFAAMDAIATADCKDAARILKDKLRDTSAKTRAKSAESLAKLGFIDDVLRLADDKEPDVRLEIAKTLAFAPSQKSADLAKQYIENDHENIKLATINSIAAWERIDLCGEILIDSLQSRSSKVRNLSAEILSSYFPDAAELLTKNHNSDKERIKIVTKIRKQLNNYLQSHENGDSTIIVTNNKSKFDSESELESGTESYRDSQKISKTNFTISDKANLNEIEINDVYELVGRLNGSSLTSIQREAIRRQLSKYGKRLLDILEYLYENEKNFATPELVDEILAENDEIFRLILSLNNDDELTRRKSAEDLLRRSKLKILGGIASSRILERGLQESDVSMLSMYATILRNSDPYKARYLAASVLQSEQFDSAELRRIACEIFGEVGNGHDLIIVAQNIGDQKRDVAHTAFEAMIKILSRLKNNEFENERAKAAKNLWSKFVGSDLISQVEISAAIYTLGDESGEKSFLRVSFSQDARVRLHVVNVIGILNDPDFISILIRYLDDKDSNVSQSALAMLPKLADEDAGIIETEIPMEHELSQSQKKIARWKKWYAENF
jgi:HEAT repeat protein